MLVNAFILHMNIKRNGTYVTGQAVDIPIAVSKKLINVQKVYKCYTTYPLALSTFINKA